MSQAERVLMTTLQCRRFRWQLLNACCPAIPLTLPWLLHVAAAAGPAGVFSSDSAGGVEVWVPSEAATVEPIKLPGAFASR